MNAQDLKNSILQLAIQGKLVEQREEEGTAKELLERVKTEKEQLIKEKKIKREKSLPEITEDEIPFDIPNNWEWVRFNDAVLYSTDYVANGSFASLRNNVKTFKEKNYALLVKTQDFANGFSRDLTYVDKASYDFLEKSRLFGGELMLSNIGASIGKAFIIPKLDIPMTLAPNSIMVKCLDDVMTKFMRYIILSFYGQRLLNDFTTGTAMPKFSKTQLRNCILPIPPYDEQKRILAKIEELKPYIENYDKAYSEVEKLNKKFPEDMQKSILQYAIQGKLVEQREEEGTAEELYQQIQEAKKRLFEKGKIKKLEKLPKITEDEVPFDIPDSWMWVRLGDLCEKIGSGSTPTGGKSVYKESGIKFLRSQNIYNDGLRMEGIVYISEEQNKQGSIVRPRDILLNITGGSIGRCALVPDDFDIANINQHVMIIRNLILENRFLLHYTLVSPYIQSMIMNVQVGVSREGLSAEKLKNFLIPVPPLEEQKRIVAKIEELMPYCQQLVR